MTSFVSSRHAESTEVCPTLCKETPFRNDSGATRLETIQAPRAVRAILRDPRSEARSVEIETPWGGNRLNC